MAQTTVSIRMDNDLKNSFDHICNELGDVHVHRRYYAG